MSQNSQNYIHVNHESEIVTMLTIIAELKLSSFIKYTPPSFTTIQNISFAKCDQVMQQPNTVSNALVKRTREAVPWRTRSATVFPALTPRFNIGPKHVGFKTDKVPLGEENLTLALLCSIISPVLILIHLEPTLYT